MKIITALFLISTVLFVSPLFAQNKIEPRVIVLYPKEIVASDEIKEALKEYESEIEITDEIRKNYVKDDLSENWKIIRTNELEFVRKQDFYSLFPYTTSTNLTYKLYELHDFPLVFPVKDVSAGDVNSLKMLAQKHDADWVVNFSKVELYEEGEKMIKAKVQLYNIISNRIFFNLEYSGKSENPGGNLECEEGSWECSVNNIVSAALTDIFHNLEKNRKYWR